MENKQQQSLSDNTPKKGEQPLTPHELVQRHINNPDEPITDEQMNNLDLSNQLSPDKKKVADEEGKLLEKDNADMSYTAEI